MGRAWSPNDTRVRVWLNATSEEPRKKPGVWEGGVPKWKKNASATIHAFNILGTLFFYYLHCTYNTKLLESSAAPMLFFFCRYKKYLFRNTVVWECDNQRNFLLKTCTIKKVSVTPYNGLDGPKAYSLLINVCLCFSSIWEYRPGTRARWIILNIFKEKNIWPCWT